MEIVNDVQSGVQSGSTKLLKASKIAVIGVSVAILSAVFSNVLTFLLSSEANRIIDKYTPGTPSTQSFVFIGVLFQVIILGVFFWLAFALRKAKSKAIAINLIIFSVLFILTDIVLILMSLATTGLMDKVYSGISSSEIQVLNQNVYYSVFIIVLAIVAWVVVLVGGITGASAPAGEFEENRLV